jgi:hypothetical protein
MDMWEAWNAYFVSLTVNNTSIWVLSLGDILIGKHCTTDDKFCETVTGKRWTQAVEFRSSGWTLTYRPIRYNEQGVLIEKLINAQIFKIIPAYYGIRRFITMFTRSIHHTLSRMTWIRVTPSFYFLLDPFNIIVSSMPRIPNRPLLFKFCDWNLLYKILKDPMDATRSVHLVLLVTIILIAFGEQYKIWSFFLWTFPILPLLPLSLV